MGGGGRGLCTPAPPSLGWLAVNVFIKTTKQAVLIIYISILSVHVMLNMFGVSSETGGSFTVFIRPSCYNISPSSNS